MGMPFIERSHAPDAAKAAPKEKANGQEVLAA
jgi:hypothetical protein